jgi:hypothetical protein
MKSFNPTSPSDTSIHSESNIVPFTARPSIDLRRAQAKTVRLPLWERFLDGLYHLLIPSSEPKVTCKQKSNGDEYYQVYDPVTGKSQTFGSELETRIWLDRRFYQ